MFCDLWFYVLRPLDFQIQKRIVSAETIRGNTAGAKNKQFCNPRAGNPGYVLLTSRIHLKYFYQCKLMEIALQSKHSVVLDLVGHHEERMRRVFAMINDTIFYT